MTSSNNLAQSFSKAKSISHLITFDRRKASFEAAVDALVAAAENEEIYNARFNEHKSSLMYGIEQAYKQLLGRLRDVIIAKGFDAFNDGIYTISTVTDINRAAKAYDKMDLGDREAAEFIEAIREIPAAIKKMKPFIKSGKAPTAPKPGAFVKPSISLSASKAATSFMTAATETFKSDLEANITKQILAAYETVKQTPDLKKLPKSMSVQMVATRVLRRQYKANQPSFVLMDDADEAVQKLIERSVRDIIEGFIWKNASKLALILEKKGEPNQHEILRTSIQNGLVENLMTFEFNDGSGFLIESSVVYKQSQHGKMFIQYPTRFRNVKMADGTTMKQPSEEKMIKEF